ncbi:hypothetical protein AB0A77_34530 [Streptomyces varsoviensis]|uniref:hypothetical protein n=1 Tax=Streptomyces varsoviensis TaxID=67373 RepID=UPI0033D768C9
MASAQHNLGLTWPTEGQAVLPLAPKDVRLVKARSSYLITGGLGGLAAASSGDNSADEVCLDLATSVGRARRAASASVSATTVSTATIT